MKLIIQNYLINYKQSVQFNLEHFKRERTDSHILNLEFLNSQVPWKSLANYMYVQLSAQNKCKTMGINVTVSDD